MVHSQPDASVPIPLRAQRRAVQIGSDSLVDVEPLRTDRPVPILVRARANGLDLRSWAASHVERIHALVLEHGGVLFRGFHVPDASAFEACIDVISGGALEYRYRASPRTHVSGNIYTATDYPADQQIFPHNEHAYSPVAPQHIYFYCERPAVSGGETPLGSTRAILSRLRAETVAKFARLGVLYVRNFGDGFGLPWQTVFQTDEPAAVEAYCEQNGIEATWKSRSRLMTRTTGPALVRHPVTGEQVWFNHATFFHVTTLPADVQQALCAQFGSTDLPQNTFYGDGSLIEPDTLATLRSAYLDGMHSFPWQRHDVMFLDNLLATHGRNAFEGERRVLTGMAKPLQVRELAVRTSEEAHDERA